MLCDPVSPKTPIGKAYRSIADLDQSTVRYVETQCIDQLQIAIIHAQSVLDSLHKELTRIT